MAFGNKRRGPRPGGVNEYFHPEERTVTTETYTCRHCQSIIETTPKSQSLIPICSKCHSFVCPMCAVKDECIPFEKRCEMEEAVQRLHIIQGGPVVGEDFRHLIERSISRTQFFVDLSKVKS